VIYNTCQDCGRDYEPACQLDEQANRCPMCRAERRKAAIEAQHEQHQQLLAADGYVLEQ
jgi:predicted Zn-ribbon and HTH transcriptional regulator